MFPTEVLVTYAQIHLLQALAILVVVRLWGHVWSGLLWDNASVVSALSSEKVKDHCSLTFCIRFGSSPPLNLNFVLFICLVRRTVRLTSCCVGISIVFLRSVFVAFPCFLNSLFLLTSLIFMIINAFLFF